MHGPLLGHDVVFPMKVAEGCYLKVRGCNGVARSCAARKQAELEEFSDRSLV